MTDTPRTDAVVERCTMAYELIGELRGAACTFERELAAVTKERDEAIERANAKENEWPRLAKYQPCGCIVCDCIGEQCAGCGARSCGTHDPREIPDAVWEDHPMARLLQSAVQRADEARACLRESMQWVEAPRNLYDFPRWRKAAGLEAS